MIRRIEHFYICCKRNELTISTDQHKDEFGFGHIIFVGVYQTLNSLAIYEQAMEKKSLDEEAIIPVHSTATMLDDRYITTEKEKNQILQTAFESLSPLRLKAFSPKEKKKIVILSKIAEQLERGKQYSEKEINQILKEIYDDYTVIRRYLVDYGFIERTADGSQYWLR